MFFDRMWGMGSIRTSVIRAAAPFFAAPLLVGCFAIADLDRFHGPRANAGSGGISGYSTSAAGLVVAVDERAGERLELRVIDAQDIVVSTAIIDRLPGTPQIVVPDIIPTEASLSLRLDFFADDVFRGNVAFAAVPYDSGAYRLDLAGRHLLDASRRPFARALGATATIRIAGLARHRNAGVVETRVFERSSSTSRLVGLHRFSAHGESAIASIPGCVNAGAAHEVTLYVDANGNGAFDDPTTQSGDLGFSVEPTSSSSGLDVTFDLGAGAGADARVASPFSLR
jgi:hypothetical protein